MKVAVFPILLLARLLCVGAEEPPAVKLTPQQRLEPEHLRATREARLRFAAERQTLPELGVYLGDDRGHSGGGRDRQSHAEVHPLKPPVGRGRTARRASELTRRRAAGK
jgi:hypothetical protein